MKQKIQAKGKALTRVQQEMADILLEGALGLIPGGAIPYKIAKASFRYRAKMRFELFHEELLTGIPKTLHGEMKEKLKSNFTVDDYYSFLNYTINDEESKAKLYGQISAFPPGTNPAKNESSFFESFKRAEYQ